MFRLECGVFYLFWWIVWFSISQYAARRTVWMHPNLEIFDGRNTNVDEAPSSALSEYDT